MSKQFFSFSRYVHNEYGRLLLGLSTFGSSCTIENRVVIFILEKYEITDYIKYKLLLLFLRKNNI